MRRIHHWLALHVASVLLLAITISHHGAASPTRILFVGNSYTAGQGGVADLVERMAAARGLAVETDSVTAGGFTLEQHWSNAAGTRDRIAGGDWDWVVLQEQSLRPIRDPERFFTYARLLDQDIRSAGAKTMFFLTWARESTPETQETLNGSYCAMVEELHAGVAPVGMAWALARERDPSLWLHVSDGSHQSDLGQYLLGMAFHRRLWNQDPAGLPHDVSPHVGVTPEQAALLQQIATEAPAGCEGLLQDNFEAGRVEPWWTTRALGASPGLIAGVSLLASLAWGREPGALRR